MNKTKQVTCDFDNSMPILIVEKLIKPSFLFEFNQAFKSTAC